MILLIYGWASVPLAYLFSLLFSTAASGFAVLALINIVAGKYFIIIIIFICLYRY